MRFGALSHIIFRFIIGAFMIVQSCINLMSYSSYLSKIEVYLTNAKLFSNEFFSLTAPLFPFLEFTLGAMLILGLYYRKTLILSILLLCGSTIFQFTNYAIEYKILMVLISILAILLYIKHRSIRKIVTNYKSITYL